MEEGGGQYLTSADRLVEFVQRVVRRRLGWSKTLVETLRDEPLMRRVSDRLYEIDRDYKLETADARQKMSAAWDKKEAAEKALLDSIQ